MDIITKKEWGARAPTRPLTKIATPTPRLWIHHTATEQHGAAGMRAIQRYHQDTKGWKDIAYSFVVDDDGSIFEGRGAGIQGGHTMGDDSRSHAICFMGDLQHRAPTAKAMIAAAELGRHGRDRRWWVPTCGGHRDNPYDDGNTTACPGDFLYKRLPDLRSMIAANPTQPKKDDDIMLIIDSPGNPALLVGGGNVKALTPTQRNALRAIGVEPKQVDDATSDALRSLID